MTESISQFLDIIALTVRLNQQLFAQGKLTNELYLVSNQADALPKRPTALTLIPEVKLYGSGDVLTLIVNYDISDFCVRYFQFEEPRVIKLNNKYFILIGNKLPEYILLDTQTDQVVMSNESYTEIVCTCAKSQTHFLKALTLLKYLDFYKQRDGVIKLNYQQQLNKIKNLSGCLDGEYLRFYKELMPEQEYFNS